jgi:hypothetical protein
MPALTPIRSSRLIPGLARDAGGDDDDVGALDVGIVVGAGDDGIVSLDRRPLDDVERLALRHALDDIDENYIAELLQPGKERQRAADLPGADQRDLVACHGNALHPRAFNRGDL